MSDYFKRYTQVCLERDRLREENAKLKELHRVEFEECAKLDGIIERMQAVVAAARACIEEKDFTQSNRISIVLANRLKDELKSYDEK